MSRRLLWLALLIALAVAGCSSTDPQYPSLLTQQGETLYSTVQSFQALRYSNGVWDPANYTSAQPDGTWQKDQAPAVADAVLAASGSSQAASLASVATATVNTAIAQHQRPDGDFDAGPPGADDTGIGATFWASEEGEIAVVLDHTASKATLASWDQSMQRYVGWLESSGNARWYSNGNVNLREALIMLEAQDLATATGDTTGAAADAKDLAAEQVFVMNPGWQPAGDFGWHQNGAAGWFSETPPGSGTGNFWCDNSPCVGFDPYYTTLQLDDALTGYVLSGYAAWWGNIVKSESAALSPLLVDGGGEINEANGSRKNPSSPGIFDPQVFAVADEHNIASSDADWSAQQSVLATEFAWDAKQPTLGPNDFAFLASDATALLDAEVQR